MSRNPIVAVLHDGRVPDSVLMEPVSQAARVRYTESAGLVEALDGTEVLFVYDFLTRSLPAAWHATTALKWLHMASTGVDPVLFPGARDSGVVVTNTRGVFDTPIAEYVLTQILCYAKDVTGSLERQRDGVWEHRDCERVAGARVVVVGTGSIGRATARLLRAVGMRVRGVGRAARADDPDFGAVDTDLHAAIAAVDYVVCVLPLTDATRNLFDARAFDAMPTHARFINVGRGETVVTDALVAALRSGGIAGAALDVVDPEPLPPDHPLWYLPGVRITPHNSGDVAGWRAELVAAFARNFARWIRNEPLADVVDMNLGYVPTVRGVR